MYKYGLFYMAASCLLALGDSQSIPTLNVFLSRLFEVTSNEIQNIANSFKFGEVSPNDITFNLYTPEKILKLDPKNISFIDASKPTKFIIHGWQTSGTDDLHKEMADKYHGKGEHNVIVVDWSKHAKKVYVHSSGSTRDTGYILANFINELTKKDSKFLGNIHLIGISLGGHVAGFAGKKVLKTTGKKIGRITGLDVAAPMFEVPIKRSADSRLSPDDADFVDIIHTNAGFLGVSGPIGTADFYVENGGPLQPDCFDPFNIFEAFGCSHFKAFEYFMDSISGKKFEALSCPNSIEYHILACNSNKRVVMGEYVPKSAKGTFYLETGSPLPYSKILDTPLGLGFKINTPRFRLPFIN